MRHIALIFASCLLTVPAAAPAARAQGIADRLAALDLDGSGHVTQHDFTLRREQVFQRFDTNRDAYLDSQEQQGLAEAARELGGGGSRRMAAVQGAMTPDSIDENRDGLISLAEFDAASIRLFALLDRNGDGEISPRDALSR